MTKQQIEKKYKVKLEREMNSYMGGRYFWSVKDEAGKEIERCETLNDVAEILRIVRAMWNRKKYIWRKFINSLYIV